MTKALRLDLLREIRHSLNRFLSILIIVAISVSVFAGLRSSSLDMAYTMDKFYDDYNVMDVHIMSTTGLTESDIAAIAETEGVEAVQAGYFVDALCNLYGSERCFRLHSLPEGYAENPSDYINQLNIVEGRLPESENEIVVEKSPTFDVGIYIGDTLTFTSGTDTLLTGNALKTDTFTVVGLVQTPYYLTQNLGNSQINDLSLDIYAYIPVSSFTYDYYIDCYAKVAGAKALNALTDEAYSDLITEVHDRLVNLGVDRSKIRGDEIRTIANNQLQENQNEYNEGLTEYDLQTSEAEQQLSEAYTQLLQGEGQLSTSREVAQLKIANAEEKLNSSEAELAAASEQLNGVKEQLVSAQEMRDDTVAMYESTLVASEQYMARQQELETLLGEITTSIEGIEQQIEATSDVEQIEALQNLLTQYQTLYNTANTEYLYLETMNTELTATVTTLNEKVEKANATVDSVNSQLVESQKEYDAGVTALANGEAELATAQEEMAAQIYGAEQQLSDGWEAYNNGLTEYEQKKADAQNELESTKEQLTESKYAIGAIQDGRWYVLDRNSNYGFASYKSTVKSTESIASIVPIFFLLVAVLVCMTTMTRMISDDRGTIGIYKALGYSDGAIVVKYILYVTTASLLGGVVGAGVGTKLFPYAVYNAWSAMYAQPALEQTPHPVIALVCILTITVAMIATAYFTCHKELISVSAELMRPKAPKIGKQILLEKIPAIWNHLSFSQKVTMRNLFRYKKRMIMTIIGITGCAALLLVGLGMNDTISSVVVNQYSKIFRFDISIMAKSSKEATVLSDELSGMDNVESFMKRGSTSVTISLDKVSEVVTLITTDNTEGLDNYILLQERTTQKHLYLDDSGIILTEQLAEQLSASVGDIVSVTDQNGITKNIPVIGITENYVYHYAYMSNTAYASYFYEGLPQTELLVQLTDDDAKWALIDDLENRSTVVSVASYTELADSFNETVKAMKSIVLLIIACSALLAFVVLYNLTNINITERIREIATIKVLGFKGTEVAMYIYRENFLLTLTGTLCGLAGGRVLHRLAMKSIEQSNVMFGYVISPLSYVEAIILTCLFSITVMLYMYPKLANIPMVESLKSVE